MRQFLSKIILCLVAMMAASAIFAVVVLALASSFFKDQHASIPTKAALVIDLTRSIQDTPAQSSPLAVVEGLIGTKAIGDGVHLKALLDAIDRAADDKRIRCIYLEGNLANSDDGAGFASLQEIRQALEDFRSSGKPIIAYLSQPSLRDYYLASVADKVILNPFSYLEFNGLATRSIFVSKALEEYGVEVQTVHVGEYKSAVETFSRDSMSTRDREQTEVLLDHLWSNIVEATAASRDIEPTILYQIANEYGILTANDAVLLGLVDELAYFDQVREALINLTHFDEQNLSFAQAPLVDYVNEGLKQEQAQYKEVTSEKGTVALIYAEGDIVDGESSNRLVGGDTLARELRLLREDPSIHAVVLRVNSPGGSALASEVIEREVRLLRQVGKPVVVSMGTFAASGGYWIAAPAHRIFAEPTTITGSIGVFGLFPNISDLAEKNGITFDGVSTGRFAQIGQLHRPMNQDELNLLQLLTESTYESFIQRVAEGRGLSVDLVKTLAEGRIWSGIDAANIGLVDELGGLKDAVAAAYELANLPTDAPLIEIPQAKSGSLSSLILGRSKASSLTQWRPALTRLEAWEKVYQGFQVLNDPKGIYARLPFNLMVD